MQDFSRGKWAMKGKFNGEIGICCPKQKGREGWFLEISGVLIGNVSQIGMEVNAGKKLIAVWLL